MRVNECDLAPKLRELARQGHAPSQMLRQVIRLVGEQQADRQFLVRAVSAAFHFQEGEGYVIFGWLPDGSGHLTDAQLDLHLAKRIRVTRSVWDACTQEQ